MVPTSKRMSRRFGTFPGVRIKREQRVAVVIDTSGSIGLATLQVFFKEIHAVWRTGAEIQVVECDAAVQRVWPYRGRAPGSVEGGGGTAFDPAFDWLRDSRNGRVDACVYLTDGFGPEPSRKPGCPVLWVVTEPAAITGGIDESTARLLFDIAGQPPPRAVPDKPPRPRVDSAQPPAFLRQVAGHARAPPADRPDH